jgi:hypothetical protein
VGEIPLISLFMGYQVPSPNLSTGGEGRSPFSLAGRRAGDEGVLSVNIVDPAIKFDFAIALTFSLDLMKFMIKCFMAIIKSF